MLAETRYPGRKTEYRQYRFPGYDVSPGAPEGSLRDTEGLTSDLYPLLSSSRLISEGIPASAINGLFSDDYLCMIEGKEIYYNLDMVGELPSSKGQSIYCLGDYLIFHPAGTFFNKLSMRSGTYGFEDNIARGNFTFGETTVTSEEPFIFTAGDFICITECDDADNMQRHLKIDSVSSDGCTLTLSNAYFTEGEFDAVICRSYGSLAQKAVRDVLFSDGEYLGSEARGCMVTTTGMPFPFKVGDCVSIRGSASNDKDGVIIREMSADRRSLVFDEDSFTVTETEENVTVSRSIPTMTYACQAGNRLWCASGRTVYASKLGDPFNWYVFDGLSTDSWQVTVGSPGTFSGCASYRGCPVFFKQNEIVRIFGTRPSNFELDVINAPGIKSGCGSSVKQVGQVLLYLSPNGVMSYAGGAPELISENFGMQRLSNGIAETDGIKYWLEALVKNKRTLFVYDSRRNIWLKESCKYIKYMVRHDGSIYLAGTDSGKQFFDTVTLEEEWSYRDLWYAEFNNITLRTHDKKEAVELHLRMELGSKGRCRVLMGYDDGEYEEVFITEEKGLRMVDIPIAPSRCDRFSLRLEGSGFFALHYLSVEFVG